jgi:hypothetical protein
MRSCVTTFVLASEQTPASYQDAFRVLIERGLSPKMADISGQVYVER